MGMSSSTSSSRARARARSSISSGPGAVVHRLADLHRGPRGAWPAPAAPRGDAQRGAEQEGALGAGVDVVDAPRGHQKHLLHRVLGIGVQEAEAHQAPPHEGEVDDWSQPRLRSAMSLTGGSARAGSPRPARGLPVHWPPSDRYSPLAPGSRNKRKVSLPRFHDQARGRSRKARRSSGPGIRPGVGEGITVIPCRRSSARCTASGWYLRSCRRSRRRAGPREPG